MHAIKSIMNTLPTHKKALIIRCLTEGMSIRSVARIADVSRNTVAKLLADAGRVCTDYQDNTLRNLNCKRIQCDEIWNFVYAKQKNVASAKAAPSKAGDVWTWTAIDADSKLIVSYLVGGRDSGYAAEFMTDVAQRLANRVQLTTDGHKAYLDAIEDTFGSEVDYAQLVKLYGPSLEREGRYSPASCIGAKLMPVTGDPDPAHISTSFVERQNLTMRMSMRRFTRLTNAFSKKIEYLVHSVSLHFMVYNFVRIHQTLKVSPAMEAGVTDRLWEISDIVAMMEAAASKPNRPVAYNKTGISN